MGVDNQPHVESTVSDARDQGGEKSLLIAMAIKRWLRTMPPSRICGIHSPSSREVGAALLGDGLEVETEEADLSRVDLQRITAADGSVGFDKDLEITSLGKNRYLLKLPATVK